MEVLRRNAFAVSVVACVVVLAAFAYFWVISPKMKYRENVSGLQTIERRFDGFRLKYSDPNTIPSQALVDWWNKRIADIKEGMKKCEDTLAGRARRFNLYFNGQPSIDPGEFQRLLNDSVNTLRGEYEAKFPPEKTDPALKDEAEGLDLERHFRGPFAPAEIPRVQKRYWMAEGIIRAAMHTGVGELEYVRPPQSERGRGPARKAEGPEVVTMEVKGRIESSRLVPFVAAILSAEKAPMQIRRLRRTKDRASLQGDVLIMKEYKTPADAEKEPYKSIAPEPDLIFHMEVEGLVWKPSGGAESG